MACSMLGTMLHLEIQKWKEAMKTLKFQKDIGGTTASMKRLDIDNKGCGQLTSNDTYFSDSCLCSIKTAEEAMAAGVDCCGLLKTIHKGFCLATLEIFMKDWPGGSYLFMKSNQSFPGERPLLDIG